MDLYTSVSYELSKTLTLRYSSSFGLSSRLFHKSIRADIYAIYGLVRIADEIVDTYRGADAKSLLNALEKEVYHALEHDFSTNMIVHSFVSTAKKYGIDLSLIAPFFASMRMDLTPTTYTPQKYKEYIYGSADVIGLMCLRVFCKGNEATYQQLKDGAAHLGSAYQKINFLRDMKADYEDLGRIYFPNTTFQTFDNKTKKAIIKDIRTDMQIAQDALTRLPKNAKKAVTASFHIYTTLLRKLEAADSNEIKNRRIRVPNYEKLYVVAKGALTP